MQKRPRSKCLVVKGYCVHRQDEADVIKEASFKNSHKNLTRALKRFLKLVFVTPHGPDMPCEIAVRTMLAYSMNSTTDSLRFVLVTSLRREWHMMKGWATP